MSSQFYSLTINTWKKKNAYWDESRPISTKLLYPMKLLPSRQWIQGKEKKILFTISKCKSKTTNEERQTTKAEISKVLDENICDIFTPNRTSFNKSETSLETRIEETVLMSVMMTCINMIREPLIVRKKLSRLIVTYCSA